MPRVGFQKVGDCYAVVCEGNVDLDNSRLTGRKGYITGPLGSSEDIFYKGGQWGTIRGMILDAGCRVTVYSEANKSGISKVYKAPMDNRILIDFMNDFARPVKSIFDTRAYVEGEKSFDVEVGDIFANQPLCRINTSSSKVFGGSYGINGNAGVYFTSDGINWSRSNQNPGSCESCHVVIPMDNGNGVHVGTEQCSGRVWDFLNDNPNFGSLIISSGTNSANRYVLGGGNTKDFGQLIGLSSAYQNIPSELWTYDNGWKLSGLPLVKNPNNGDSRGVWSLIQYLDWLILGTAWSGPDWNNPTAGEILAFKNGMSDYVVKNANIGGFVKGLVVLGDTLYASYGNRFSWTNDPNLDNWTTIKSPAVANYNMVPIDNRYLLGIWYTGKRFSNWFNEPIKVVLVTFDTVTKSFEEIYDFGITDDPEADCYSTSGGVCKLSDTFVAVVNHHQNAQAFRITID